MTGQGIRYEPRQGSFEFARDPQRRFAFAVPWIEEELEAMERLLARVIAATEAQVAPAGGRPRFGERLVSP